MSIPFDNAVGTLQSMFPEWDPETLTTLLISNNYHVERTIESILTMQGDMNVGAANNDVNETDNVSNTYDFVFSFENRMLY